MAARDYSATRSIDAPAFPVLSLLTDAATYQDWNKSVISIEGPIQQGNTIKLVSIADPKRSFKLKVAEMDAPTLEAFTGPLAALITRAIPDLTDSFNTFAYSLKSGAETRHAS